MFSTLYGFFFILNVLYNVICYLFQLDQSKILLSGDGLTHNPDFLTTSKTESFRKHFEKKEKMLVTSIFSFSQNVF